MIRRALGCTFGSCLLVLSGVTAVGAGGYMTMTGNSVCSLVQGCCEKTTNSADNKNVTTVAAKEGEKKSGCSLSKTAAAKSGGCNKAAEGEATVVQASAKSGGCSKPSTGEGKVEAVAAKSGEGAKACSAAKVASAKRGFYLMNGSVPVAMPAMFYNNKAAFCTASLKEVSGCDKPRPSEAAVSTVAATEAKSGCCKGKTAAVSTVAAKEGAAAGCCKDTGTRADGTPGQKDGPQCDQGQKTAEGEKAPAEAPKSGEPVASRE